MKSHIIEKGSTGWCIRLSRNYANKLAEFIRRQRFPYVHNVWVFDNDSCLDIIVSRFMEEQECSELEGAIIDWCEERMRYRIKHRKKLTTFIPKYLWSR